MENLEVTQDIALELIPEIDDILDCQPVGQQLIVSPHEAGILKTKSGLFLESHQTKLIKNNLLQRGTVVCAGSKCSEIKKDMTVFYYNSAWKGQGACIRQGDDLYYLMQEYDIKMYVNSPVRKVAKLND